MQSVGCLQIIRNYFNTSKNSKNVEKSHKIFPQKNIIKKINKTKKLEKERPFTLYKGQPFFIENKKFLYNFFNNDKLISDSFNVQKRDYNLYSSSKSENWKVQRKLQWPTTWIWDYMAFLKGKAGRSWSEFLKKKMPQVFPTETIVLSNTWNKMNRNKQLEGELTEKLKDGTLNSADLEGFLKETNNYAPLILARDAKRRNIVHKAYHFDCFPFVQALVKSAANQPDVWKALLDAGDRKCKKPFYYAFKALLSKCEKPEINLDNFKKLISDYLDPIGHVMCHLTYNKICKRLRDTELTSADAQAKFDELKKRVTSWAYVKTRNRFFEMEKKRINLSRELVQNLLKTLKLSGKDSEEVLRSQWAEITKIMAPLDLYKMVVDRKKSTSLLDYVCEKNEPEKLKIILQVIKNNQKNKMDKLLIESLGRSSTKEAVEQTLLQLKDISTEKANAKEMMEQALYKELIKNELFEKLKKNNIEDVKTYISMLNKKEVSSFIKTLPVDSNGFSAFYRACELKSPAMLKMLLGHAEKDRFLENALLPLNEGEFHESPLSRVISLASKREDNLTQEFIDLLMSKTIELFKLKNNLERFSVLSELMREAPKEADKIGSYLGNYVTDWITKRKKPEKSLAEYRQKRLRQKTVNG